MAALIATPSNNDDCGDEELLTDYGARLTEAPEDDVVDSEWVDEEREAL